MWVGAKIGYMRYRKIHAGSNLVVYLLREKLDWVTILSGAEMRGAEINQLEARRSRLYAEDPED